MKEEGIFVHDYITKARTIENHLTIIGEPMLDRDLVMYSYTRLNTNSSYNPL